MACVVLSREGKRREGKGREKRSIKLPKTSHFELRIHSIKNGALIHEVHYVHLCPNIDTFRNLAESVRYIPYPYAHITFNSYLVLFDT